jgi:gamma-butyrobetaine dioxygenase
LPNEKFIRCPKEEGGCLAKALDLNNWKRQVAEYCDLHNTIMMNLGYQRGLRAHQFLGLSKQIIPFFRRTYTEARAQITDSQLIVPALCASFPYRWLRDACQCATCVHPSTSQKLRRTSDIPADVRPIPYGVTFQDSGIHVEWADNHKSFYEHSFLERYSSSQRLSSFHKDIQQISWDVSTISQIPDLYMTYEAIKKPSQLLSAITQLTRYGILFLTGVPNTEHTNETCELRKLANIFGELRETFYGELWDVKNISDSKNIAYTNLDLGVHMDLLYVVSVCCVDEALMIKQILPTPSSISNSPLPS